MIKMTRLRLINWHNFQDNIIDFKDITYLLGVNAVGKTTIMDAIRYCLTTNKDFNTAGNKKSGRTLLGSVHQKQRAENSYLRLGHTVSYIGIEFLDESINKYFVISVRVESETPKQELKGVSQDWYITKSGYKLEDIPYFTETKKGKKPTSKDAFRLDNRGMEKASSQADARRKICRVLGIGDADSQIGKKFNEVFHMGTSLEDIKDIREFIYTYILPEPEINIECLKKDMYELERLQEILQGAKDREVLLKNINEKIKYAKEMLFKVKTNKILAAYAKYKNNVEEQKENENKIISCVSSISILSEKLEELEEKYKNAQDQLLEAKKATEDNEFNKTIDALEKQNTENNKDYKRLINEAAVFSSLSKELSELKKRLNHNDFKCQWNNAIFENYELLEQNRIEEIRKAKKELNNIEDDLKDKSSQIRNDLKENINKRKAIEEQIKFLENGIMYYPKEAILVRNTINEALLKRIKKQEAKFLCELLYMTDNSWQNSVESYLNTQRFNIIVSPENYLIAKEAFISLGENVKGIGIIDTRKIKKINDFDTKVKYLSQTVESENIYAKGYVDFIMKGVVCCDNPDDIEKYHKSVTKDRLRFQNYCLQRMGKKDPFIGVDAAAKQLEKAKKELISVKTLISELEIKKKKFDELERIYNKFTTNDNIFLYLEKYCNSQPKAKILGIKIKEINDKIEDFKKNPIMLAMYNRVEECEKALNNISNEISYKKADKRNLERDIENANNKISELKILHNSLKIDYETMLSEYPEYESEVINIYTRERKTKKISSIISKLDNIILQDRNKLDNYINQELIPLQRIYTSTYTCDFPEGIVGATRYQQEYTSLLNIELECHTKELKHPQSRCTQRFRKEVLFRMKDDILRAKQQFKQINKVMENLEYGEESYIFDIGKSKDKELGLFYDIIMDKDNQQIEQDNQISIYLAEITKSEVFESQIEDFMNRIMSDIEEQAKENLSGKKNSSKGMNLYVDYRTYLDYDIIVKNSVTGNKVPLSKVSGEGSGGENQAPFYVAICASLLQIYNNNPNGTIRLILLDEAFNNMTSDRIEPMMKMFKSKDLSLQLVLIATPEKATSIIPYCDITYSIIKSGNINAIKDFKKE